MTTTTAAAVRDAMQTLIEAITPAVHARDTFQRFREQQDFRTWAEANPTSCLRRFSIKYGDRQEASVSDTIIEENRWTFVVTVAYPVSNRFGAEGLDDLEDTITSDLKQIYARIGPPGYASFTAPATVLGDGEELDRGEKVALASLRFQVWFYRSLVS